MHYSIELHFDSGTSESLVRAWSLLAGASGSDHMPVHGAFPHVSLTGFDIEGDDPPRARAAFDRCAGSLGAFPLVPWGIGVFPGGVVFVGITVDARLLAVHAAVFAALEQEGLEAHPYYRPGAWQPHCTLAMQVAPDRLAGTVAAAAALNLDFPYLVREAALVSHPPARIVRRRVPLR